MFASPSMLHRQSPRAPVNNISAEEEFKANVQDIFFDYDNYDVRSDAQTTLAHDAAYLTSHPNVKVLIGGYCDERGSNEYNLVLGQNRADAAKKGVGQCRSGGQSHPHHQLRQGEALLHRVNGVLLAKESSSRVFHGSLEHQ
jgi:hypothetical protein